MPAIHLTLIAFYTAVLGSLGILLCLLVPGGRALIPLARLWSWLVLRTCRVTYGARYDPGLDPGRSCVYVANHQSQFDIPALALAMPADFRMVAKRALLYVPIFGWALWLAGFVFIDRTDRDRAIRSLERAALRLRGGTSIVVFAEGTRSRDGRLLPFKKGGFVLALQAGVPIVPVTIRGGLAVLPRGSLRVRPGHLEVIFGAPIDTTGFSMQTKEALIEETRRAIAARLAG
ncbi:MAG TPA: lysophospholipid acyltransferase family protein [Candidatus Polarisedimenticolia bacterium]|nr:lysophospholipid acyltransferase family protein [Candidatus Polarisedimenticolia bacterium]